jgi:inner membrane protein
MDSLTQIVLGASVGEAVLGKKIGNRAILWGAVAGTIPDLDVFLKFFTDSITSTEMHRGFSHSILFAILAAPLLGWLVHKIHKNRLATRKDWNWLFFWSLVTHPLLDANTTWGTQLFWPFEYRVAYKNIFVADPLYTVPFLILVIAVMFFKRTNPKRTKINNWALIISTSYMALTFVFKSAAHYQFSSALKANGIEYVEMDTQPAPLNTILWTAQVETKTGMLSGSYSLFDTQPIQFHDEIPKNHDLLLPHLKNKQVQQILKIAGSWYFIEENKEGLVFTDIRFGQFGFKVDSPYMWKYSIQKNPDGKIIVKRIDFSPGDINFKETFGQLIQRIKGN